jgi:hypothetical protein
LQITGRDRGYPALTHLKGHRRIGASIFGPNLNGLPQAVSGVPSAREVARSRALAKLLSDFSLDAESSWCLVHRPRDPYGRSYRPWAPGGELGALARDGVPVSSRKSESALASRLLEICSHINSPRVGSLLFPELRVASLSGASVSPWNALPLARFLFINGKPEHTNAGFWCFVFRSGFFALDICMGPMIVFGPARSG